MQSLEYSLIFTKIVTIENRISEMLSESKRCCKILKIPKDLCKAVSVSVKLQTCSQEFPTLV